MLEIHPVAAALPPIGDAAFAALVANVETKGQTLPIVLYEGMIWDGRARYRACLNLGLKPWLVPLRGSDPADFYIVSNYGRVGLPGSATRKSITAILLKAGSPEGRKEGRARRSAWIRQARREFEELVRNEREPCAVCKQHIDFVHAHHAFPLSLQFECGVDQAVHKYQWLCPVHHRRVHILLGGYLLGTRDLSFLDGIPDRYADEWEAIGDCARQGIDLCCEALGQVSEKNDKRRYDPPYSLFLLRHADVFGIRL